MAAKTISVASSALEQIVGSFGLALIVLLGWAYEQRNVDHAPVPRARRVFAWLVIESITAIGWAIDRIAPINAT